MRATAAGDSVLSDKAARLGPESLPVTRTRPSASAAALHYFCFHHCQCGRGQACRRAAGTASAAGVTFSHVAAVKDRHGHGDGTIIVSLTDSVGTGRRPAGARLQVGLATGS